MARDIVLNFQIRLPRWSTRRWLVIALVVLGISAGAVYAKVNWTPFVGGAKLTSQQLNDNFKAMGDAIELLQAQPPVQRLHLYDEANKVDVGVYLTSHTPWANGGGQPVHFVWNDAVKAPMLVSQFDRNGTLVSGIQFDGNNCAGNAYMTGTVPAGEVFGGNLAFNTAAGTIFQITGVAVGNLGVLTMMDDKGMCKLAPGTVGNPYTVKDTKVPNMKPIDMRAASLKLM